MTLNLVLGMCFFCFNSVNMVTERPITHCLNSFSGVGIYLQATKVSDQIISRVNWNNCRRESKASAGKAVRWSLYLLAEFIKLSQLSFFCLFVFFVSLLSEPAELYTEGQDWHC